MTTSEVILRGARGTLRIVVPHSVLATESAIIDMARSKAGLEPNELKHGEIAQ